jgi:hypothetical protein
MAGAWARAEPSAEAAATDVLARRMLRRLKAPFVRPRPSGLSLSLMTCSFSSAAIGFTASRARQLYLLEVR